MKPQGLSATIGTVMAIKIRSVAPEEILEFFRIGAIPFSDETDAAEAELELALIDRDRMVTADDDGAMVASGAAFTFDMAIPGGSAGAAGITWIGVFPRTGDGDPDRHDGPPA